MKQSRESAKPVITGFYTMTAEKGRIVSLSMDEDLLEKLALKPTISTKSICEQWLERIIPEDRAAVEHAVASCIGGLQAEVRFRWQHASAGLMLVSCTGVLDSREGDCSVMKGFFKVTPYEDFGENSIESDASIYKSVAFDIILESFSFFGLVSVDTNKMIILRDTFDSAPLDLSLIHI